MMINLLSTISTEFDRCDQCYVLHLAYSTPTATLAAALSNRAVKLFTLREANLQFVGELTGHGGTITAAVFPFKDEPHTLHTASADGYVREWDIRSGIVVRSFSAGPQEVACCASNGTLLAAGARDTIVLWDRRRHGLPVVFPDTHGQDVVQLAFPMEHPGKMISGSEDGLIAVFDLSGGLDEDEGFCGALNIETAVARLGFYGRDSNHLWCCSGTESIHLWAWAAACDEEAAGGQGCLGQSLDPRSQLRFTEEGVNMNFNDELTTTTSADYLIQCEYDAGADMLAVAAGTSDGKIGLFPIGGGPSTMLHGELTFLTPFSTMDGGHDDVVRSLVWVKEGPGEKAPLWLTGGEDARVCLWGTGVSERRPPGSGGSEGVSREHGHARMQRASPY